MSDLLMDEATNPNNTPAKQGTPAPKLPRGPGDIAEPLAKFKAESGPSISVLPDLSLNFEDFPAGDDKAEIAALRQILNHTLPLHVILMQLQQLVDQAVLFDMLGKIRLITVSEPKDAKEALAFKGRITGISQNYAALRDRAAGE